MIKSNDNEAKVKIFKKKREKIESWKKKQSNNEKIVNDIFNLAVKEIKDRGLLPAIANNFYNKHKKIVEDYYEGYDTDFLESVAEQQNSSVGEVDKGIRDSKLRPLKCRFEKMPKEIQEYIIENSKSELRSDEFKLDFETLLKK